MSKTNASQHQPIAVVGMACIFPKAKDLDGFWQVIRMGVDTISEVPDTHWRPDDYFDSDQKAPDKTYCQRGGFLDAVGFDPTEFSLPPTVLEATDTSQLLGLVVAKAALEDAGYTPEREFDKEKTSIILGVTGCLELVIPLGARLGHPYWRKALLESGVDPATAEEVMERIADDYVPWQENSFPGLLGNVVAGRIANRLDLHGTNCVVDAACASTLSAAHLAMMELQTGKADVVVTGGADTFNDIFMYMCFSKTPALSPSGKIRPFDADSDGTLIGEGIGMVVLKRLDEAQRDGDRVYCVIRGMGTSSDGSQKAVYAPYSPGQARALRRAYEAAGVEPQTVELVEAHGTGTKVGDVVEFEALKGVYSEAGQGKQWCALGSVKSQIGHTKAAAGAAGLIKAALALYHKVLPPTINVTAPNPKLGIEDSPFYLNTEARPWLANSQHPRRAALSSFGFGGSNFHTVLEEHDAKKAQPSWDNSLELVAYSAATRAELIAQLESELKASHELARAAHTSRQNFKADHHCRLVLVVEAGKFQARLKAAKEKLEAGQNPEFYGEGPAPGPVAFLFPGQGSQYVGMARELACIFPEMLESLHAMGEPIPQKIYPIPTFSKADQKLQQAELTSTDMAQPALGAISLGMYRILERFGVTPEFTAGHSYGELVALHAAGVFDEAALAELSRLRGSLMANLGDDLGTMLAVTGPLEQVEEALKKAKLDLKLANRNSPTQGVLSGSKEEIAKAGPIMKEAGFSVIALQVAAAFHSPLVAGARGPFREGMNSIKFKKANLPVYANMTARAYPSAEKKAKDLLADQLVNDVHFVAQIEKMHADGARVFIEVGPKRVLSRLVPAILGDKEHVAVALDASQGKKRSLVDLARALAELAALGLPVNLTAWEKEPKPARLKRMEIPISGANYRAPRKPIPPRPKKAVAPATPTVSQTVGQTVDGSRPATSQTVAAPKAPVVTAKVAAPAPSAVNSQVFQDAFQSVQSTLSAMQAMAQQTAEAHQRFLEGQEQAQRTFQKMVEGQQSLVAQMMGQTPSQTVGQTVGQTASQTVDGSRKTVVAKAATVAPAPVVAVASKSVPVVKAAPVAKPAAAGDKVAQTILAVVAEKTGYPVDMLHLGMDLEADLGIDSIKRVEILAAVEEAVPGLPRIEPDQMGSLRTLAEIVDKLGAAAPAAQPITKQADSGVTTTLLAVVAEKTGYPAEMLNLDMDLEADLGIDSIKRVEILAAVEEAVPGLPRVEPDQMGALRTLGQIVEALGASPSMAQPATRPAAVDAGVTTTLLSVVAEKTGYPVDMLNLEMDLEADLGIDSIKRVEILAAVEEAVPGLPRVEPDQMGALRTLGQIVEVLGVSPVMAHPVNRSAVDTSVTTTLLGVVAEKTGYPVDMLNLDMDLEADLGIDSIKRVEILAAVEEAVPGLPRVAPDQMGSLRTLGQIVEVLGVSPGVTAVASQPAPVATGVTTTLLTVVAEKTGYPVDMLNLDMDLEADLGIDSIKRVEILAAVEEAIPGLPKVAADQMGSLRTLGQIVEVLGVGPAPTQEPADQTQDVLLSVVAEKTGYPVEMLNLDMDLEADLGIDSIKRVEILAAVEEAIPGLPKVAADQMGSLRSLRQVLGALGHGSNGVAQAAAPARPLGRKVLRAVQLEAGQMMGFPVTRGVLAVAEDQPGLGESIVAALKGRGLKAEVVQGDLPGDLSGLILVANGGQWEATEKFLKQAFLLTKQAAKSLRETKGMLVTVSRTDGSFGMAAKSFDPLAGALAGLPKTVAHEWPEVWVRALDVAREIDGEAVVSELCLDGPIEVGLQPDRRLGLVIDSVATEAGPPALGQGDLVVITGGARGVTAHTAIALAKAVRPNFMLLGRSEVPSAEPEWLAGLTDAAAIKKTLLAREFNGKATPVELEQSYRSHMANREIRQTLAALEQAGSKAEYRSVDIRDRKAVKKVLADTKLGPVKGVVHGAGVLADRRIEDKTPEQFDSVFDTKVSGLRNLLDLTKNLKALVLFSSVTSRFGRPGQLDYCMANEVLNKVAQQYARQNPDCKVASMCWGPWEGGMVTPGLKKEFERLGVGLIPLDGGAQALVKELSHPAKDEIEVLIGDGFPEPERPAPRLTATASTLSPVLERKLSTENFPFLESHVIGGRPVLPVAVILEWFAHAALHGNIGLRFFGIEDLRVLRGLALENGVEPTIAVSAGELVPDGDGFRVEVELRDQTRNILHARGTVLLAPDLPSAPTLEPVNGLASQAYPYEPGQIYDKLLFHGSHFQGIKAVEGISDEGLVADLKAAPKPSKWVLDPVRSEWLTDPLVVDSILQLGILWCIEQMEKPSLPNGGARYRQYRRRFPREGARAILRVSSHSAHRMSANVYLTDAAGEVVASFEGVEWTADANLRKAFAKKVLATP
ncbi:MAG: SDR family NAD(P)-dependent oxidoreductase [Vulcanimicrobiota bacterium]